MDENIRAERIWLLKNYMERINDPDSTCPPLIDMYVALLAAYLHHSLPDAAWDFAHRVNSEWAKTEADLLMRFSVGQGLLEWIGVSAESAPEMFRPEHLHANWRASIGEPGYVTFRAVTKMLDHFADTGQIHWQVSVDETNALEQLCASYGIVWLAWQAEPQRGWMPPGAERTAIVRFDSETAQSTEIYLLEQLVSDIAGCNVSLITPEQIWEERRQPELERAEVIYAQVD